jgi:hypothetical protein
MDVVLFFIIIGEVWFGKFGIGGFVTQESLLSLLILFSQEVIDSE